MKNKREEYDTLKKWQKEFDKTRNRDDYDEDWIKKIYEEWLLHSNKSKKISSKNNQS